jgi:hypothetical protein
VPSRSGAERHVPQSSRQTESQGKRRRDKGIAEHLLPVALAALAEMGTAAQRR